MKGMNKEYCSNKYICFIVNPVSGNGKSLKIFSAMENYLKKREILYRVHYTEYKEHAIELAKEFKNNKGICVVVAVGGDGTIHEVINGLHPSIIPVGYIPAGSGNDYAKEIGIPMDPISALEKILELNIRKIDIGKMNNRYFINVSSMGFDGLVAYYANQAILKSYIGKLVYVYGVIKALIVFRPFTIEMQVDDEKKSYEKVWLIAAANHRYYGGGMAICPQAKNNDGYLDICIIKDISHMKFIMLFPTIFFGKHIYYPMVKVLKGKKMKISASKKNFSQADGEIFHGHHLQVEIIKKGLLIV